VVIRGSQASLLLLASGWLLCVVTGFGLLLRYKNTAGPSPAGPPQVWPLESAVPSPRGRATLLMFAHPHCPCTEASVSELARLMSRYAGRLHARVLLVDPPDVAAGWDDTVLSERARSIPGVWLGQDKGGREAARFSARVSGFSLLYDAEGRLLFAGGLTAMRGHEGGSLGLRQIAAAVEGRPLETRRGPTFGCALQDPAAEAGS
jgi:hypothetical protein